MKFIHSIITLSIVVLVTGACTPDNGNSYAIRDFRKFLQPHLTAIVSQGVVGFDTSVRFIEHYATDNELTELSHSEHPVLRAVALRILLGRPGVDHFKVLMSHLSDTAIVTCDMGERGWKYYMVSDDAIQNARWKTENDKTKTIDEVIRNYNYLSSAYIGLSKIKKDTQYYSIVKVMAQRDRNFDDIEYALYHLASYRNKEDVPLIKQILLVHKHWMSSGSFGLMQDYPDTSYMEVYEKYYPRNFYRRICLDHIDYEMPHFIKSLASYKNERAASILSQMLNRKPLIPCSADTTTLMRQLYYAIWNNECIAYTSLRKKIAGTIKEWEETNKSFYLPIDKLAIPKDTSSEPICW